MIGRAFRRWVVDAVRLESVDFPSRLPENVQTQIIGVRNDIKRQ